MIEATQHARPAEQRSSAARSGGPGAGADGGATAETFGATLQARLKDNPAAFAQQAPVDRTPYDAGSLSNAPTATAGNNAADARSTLSTDDSQAQPLPAAINRPPLDAPKPAPRAEAEAATSSRSLHGESLSTTPDSARRKVASKGNTANSDSAPSSSENQSTATPALQACDVTLTSVPPCPAPQSQIQPESNASAGVEAKGAGARTAQRVRDNTRSPAPATARDTAQGSEPAGTSLAAGPVAQRTHAAEPTQPPIVMQTGTAEASAPAGLVSHPAQGTVTPGGATPSGNHGSLNTAPSSTPASFPQPAAEAGVLLTANPTVLEVGIPGATHGWLKVRAEWSDTGGVNAQLAASSASAVSSLHKELPALAAYLQQQQVAVASLSVQAAAQQPGFGFGAQANPDPNSAGRNSREGTRGQSGGRGPDTSAPAESLELNGLGPLLSFGPSGGGWLSVRV